jgi:hypothetical protein
MIQYLNNIIPRLKQYSIDLDRKELFIDKPWVIIDDKLNQEKYIFRRNGELVMSLNGKVTLGKWEHIPTAHSLLIDRIHDRILLNQAFVDSAVMVLKMDGINDNYLILVNEVYLPDLNVELYLKQIFYEKHNITTRRLESGQTLELYDYYYLNDFYLTGINVSINGDNVKDGFYESPEYKTKYLIQDSKIARVLVLRVYNSPQGLITIEQTSFAFPKVGDNVFIKNLPAPDGIYSLGLFKKITVKNGQIIKKRIITFLML